MTMPARFSVLFLAALLVFPGCARLPPPPTGMTLAPVSYAELPGWQQDDLAQARPALLASCARLKAVPATRSLGAEGRMGTAADWQDFCAALPEATTTPALRQLLETRLQPYTVGAGNSPQGLFTGYYEPELHGSLTPDEAHQTPLYRRPDDLVTVDLGEFRDTFRGQKLAGRVENGQLRPYPDRAAITAGALTGRNLELVWLDDPVDAFFVQVQGSGRVLLKEGGELRVGYAAQNGHPYVAIGRELIARGELTPETVSLQSIRGWLTGHPDQARDLMNTNPSYVFFQPLTPASPQDGPQGAANVALTPQRSLAVDNRFIGYHVPVWLTADQPALARLMVAQDTGGAITGAVRGDVFWGHGPQAELMAGQMKSAGRYFVLLPRHLRVSLSP